MNTDVCIIGAGPVGLFTIFQAGMLGMKCHIIDTLAFPGGQCSALYPEKQIYDIPAHQKITGQELIDNLLEQGRKFDPVFHFETTAIDIQGNKNIGFSVTIKDKEGKTDIISAKAVIIAGGCGSFGANKPPLDNIEKYENKQILYFIDNIARFTDKSIMIAGGGDSAVDWAISLANIAKSVAIVHRRENFRCMPESEAKLITLINEGKIRILTPFQLLSIIEKDNILTGIKVQNINTNEGINLEIDYLLPFFGLKTDLGAIENWGLDLHKRTIKVQNSSMETSRSGIYAIGDICHYDGKLKLILCGFSESAIAVHHLYNIVFPNRPLHFEHSTSKGIKQ